jgi:hypothetical protein
MVYSCACSAPLTAMEIEMISFTDIPFALDAGQLMGSLRITPGTDRGEEFEEIVGEVREIAKPKALYRVSFIDEKGEDTVTLDGITFTSRALRKNLDSIERVFPYVATCGSEIDGIDPGPGDYRKKLWISFLKATLLERSIQYLGEQLERRYRVSKLSAMNPGSGDASVWPIEQQRELFSLFGDVEKHIGVRLTESLVMVPDMSVSGILFPTETDFQSCQLCHREDCRFRKAAFDRELWDSIGES